EVNLPLPPRKLDRGSGGSLVQLAGAGRDAHRRLCTDRRLRDRGPGGTRRIDRLALLAAVRFGGLLCGVAWIARPWALADRPQTRRRARGSAIPSQYADS